MKTSTFYINAALILALGGDTILADQSKLPFILTDHLHCAADASATSADRQAKNAAQPVADPMTYKDGVWYATLVSSEVIRESWRGHADKLEIAVPKGQIDKFTFAGHEFRVTEGHPIVDMRAMPDKGSEEVARMRAERLELGHNLYVCQNDGLGMHLGDAGKHDPTLSISTRGITGCRIRLAWNF